MKLITAAKRGNTLVPAGADANLADRTGVTPLDHARWRSYQEIISIPARAGAR